MKISQLNIELFQGLPKLNLHFDPSKLTAIIGENGVGKSECLKAIDYVSRQQKETTEFIVAHYSANRTILEVRQSEFTQDSDSDLSRFFRWFRNWASREYNEKQECKDYLDRELDTVRRAISQVTPEFSQLQVYGGFNHLTIEKYGERLGIEQLSNGERCLIAMVGDLAMQLAIANPEFHDPLQGEGVVLIDEIELHLHPGWHRRIVPALTQTFPNCQFIITTNSPQVLSCVKPEAIIILEREDGRVVVKSAESSYGRDSNRILEDLMNTPSRPQEFKEAIHEIFREIADGNLQRARQLTNRLSGEIGDDPEIVAAEVSIRRREIIGK